MDSTELVDMMIDGATPTEVQDKITDLLYAKSVEKVDAMKPEVAQGLFGDQPEVEPEVNAEVEQEPTTETEE
mgnify:FL=1|tara:strand:- start:6 stop:221 length:216 start_codon:yes stop_codon:yes gene_type:complete